MIKSEIDVLEKASEFHKLAKVTIPTIAQAMVAEYEQKRKAYEAKNTTYQKRGKIDTKRLVKYQVVDDIFKTKKVTPDGMSHGLFLCIDWSASMRHNVAQMAIQYLVTALFAKRAGIPFKISFFTSGQQSGKLNHKLLVDNTMSEADIREIFYHMICFNAINGYNNYTKNKQFSAQYKKMLIDKFYMASTPLLDVAIDVYKHAYEMKQQLSIQSMNVLFITDGGHSGRGLINNTMPVSSVVCPYTSRRYDIKNLGDECMPHFPHFVARYTRLLSPINRMYRDSGIRVSNMYICNNYPDLPDLVTYIDDSLDVYKFREIEKSFSKLSTKYCVIENAASYNKLIYVKRSIFPIISNTDYNLDGDNYNKLSRDFIKNAAETKSLTVVCRMIVSDMCSDME